MTTPTAPTGWPTVSVQFSWGETALSFPSGSRLYRPDGEDDCAFVTDPAGHVFTVNEWYCTGRLGWPDQPDTVANLVAAGVLVHDQSVTFP